MHPKRPSFCHWGGEGGVDGVLLQFDVSKCIPYDSFMFPNSSIPYPISAFAQIPNYIGSPK
jgi:hypothetical protein